MATPIFERLGLNPREQRMATLAVVIFGVAFVIGIPLWLQLTVSSRAAENDELRATLTHVNESRGKIQETKAKKEAVTRRYANKAPALAGFIEQKASAQKLQVANAVDRNATPHGKRYVERHTQVSLRKSGMLGIAKFFESLETSGHPIALTQLKLRKRAAEPDSYDIEFGLSAYDRTEPKKSASPAPDATEGK